MAIALAGGGLVYQQVTDSGGVTITCNQSSTSAADFTSDLSAISNGQTLCLTNAVDYGTFSGTTKNITIVAQAGSGAEDPVDATLKVSVGSGDTGTVTIDGGMDRWDAPEGLNIFDAGISTGAANLTITDFQIDPAGGCDPPNDGGRCWLIDPAPIDSNITIDHFYAHDATDGEAVFYIDDGSTTGNTGITIQNGLFRHMSTDGVKLTGNESVTVKNNKFMDMHGSYDTGGAENHTDGIQMLEGNHVLTGNWLTDSDQCIFSDDGTTNNTVSHNLIDNCGQHFMTISWDVSPGSVESFNTITTRTQDLSPYYECGTNDGSGGQSVPNIQNNIFQQINLAGSNGGPNCVPVANHHNMLKTGESTTGTGGSNFTGTQTYAGGADLSTFDSFADFCLAGGSDGDNDATNGGQVGICGGDYNGSNYGPPAGEGY